MIQLIWISVLATFKCVQSRVGERITTQSNVETSLKKSEEVCAISWENLVSI